jgi:hypothetical protein
VDLRNELDQASQDLRVTPSTLDRVRELGRHREHRRRIGGAIVGVSLLGVVAIGLLAVTGTFRPSSGVNRATSGDTRVPAGTLHLPGVTPKPECPTPGPEGFISCEEALAVAAKEAGTPESRRASSVDAILDWYAESQGSEPVRVWIVTYRDAIQPIHGPTNYEGPTCSLGDWRIVVDAAGGTVVAQDGSGVPTPCPEGELVEPGG